MSVLADPIVRAKLKEFNTTVEALVEAEFMTVGDQLQVIRELCELSRNTKFDLGPLRFADSDQAAKVAASFEDAVSRIRGLWADSQVPEDAEKYCRNIERRAHRCRVAE